MLSQNLRIDDCRLWSQILQDIERGGRGDKFEVMIVRKTRADFGVTEKKRPVNRIASVR